MFKSELWQALLEQYGLLFVLLLTFGSSLASAVIAFINFWANRNLIRRQLDQQFELQEAQFDRQREVIDARARAQLEAIDEQFRKDEERRQTENLDLERAERLIVLQYCRNTAARVTRLALSNQQTASTWANEDANNSTPLIPARTEFIWTAFALFQLIAAFNMASSARRHRRLSKNQEVFLNIYDRKILTVLCRAAHPGRPFFYPEQLEIIGEEMLKKAPETQLLRPLHWSEFVALRDSDHILWQLAVRFSNRLADLASHHPYEREPPKTRLAVLSMYLQYVMQHHPGFNAHRVERLRKQIHQQFTWAQENEAEQPDWFVFDEGDPLNGVPFPETISETTSDNEDISEEQNQLP